MSIPEHVKVGPLLYKVGVVDDLKNENGSPLEGRIRYPEQVITIRNMQPGRMYMILWHELLHAIDDLAGTGLDEDTITRLTPVIVAVLIDNAPLV